MSKKETLNILLEGNSSNSMAYVIIHYPQITVIEKCISRPEIHKKIDMVTKVSILNAFNASGNVAFR